MKHVHAETIIELAQDLSKVAQFRIKGATNPWSEIQPEFNKIEYICQLTSDFETRIKPKPKAISWTNMYMTVGAGRTFSKRENAEIEAAKRNDLVATVEIRDDGTAHLHKVEA